MENTAYTVRLEHVHRRAITINDSNPQLAPALWVKSEPNDPRQTGGAARSAIQTAVADIVAESKVTKIPPTNGTTRQQLPTTGSGLQPPASAASSLRGLQPPRPAACSLQNLGTCPLRERYPKRWRSLPVRQTAILSVPVAREKKGESKIGLFVLLAGVKLQTYIPNTMSLSHP